MLPPDTARVWSFLKEQPALAGLCSGIPQKDDEGYAHLLPNAPTLDEMKNFFISQRDQLEIQLAAEALRSRQSSVADKRGVPPE